MQLNSFFNGIEDKIRTEGNPDYFRWSCFYVHHLPIITDWTLINVVKPIIDNLISEKIIKSFFFIRFNEDGYHLRLRFKIESANQTYLSEYLQSSFLNASYSLREKNLLFADVPYAEIFKVTTHEYQPEVERYGGMSGILLAEDLFCQSSFTVLEIMNRIDNWQIDNAIPIAVAMHHILIHFLIPENAERHAFYSYTSNIWANRALLFLRKVTNSDTNIDWEKLQNLYLGSYARVKPELSKAINELSTKLKNNKRLDNPSLEHWAHFAKSYSQKITNSIASGDLILLHESPHSIKSYYSLFESYLHMNNNRLGISNYNESFVYYILQQLEYEKITE